MMVFYFFPAETKKEEAINNPSKSDFRKINTLPAAEKDIDRIVIFYKDGSFQNFENS